MTSFLKTSFIFGFATVLSISNAFASIEEDRSNILGFAGCYKVTYQFAETFVLTEGEYKKSDNYKETTTEWISIEDQAQDHISLQHILILPHGFIKHLREDWTLN